MYNIIIIIFKISFKKILLCRKNRFLSQKLKYDTKTDFASKNYSVSKKNICEYSSILCQKFFWPKTHVVSNNTISVTKAQIFVKKLFLCQKLILFKIFCFKNSIFRQGSKVSVYSLKNFLRQKLNFSSWVYFQPKFNFLTLFEFKILWMFHFKPKLTSSDMKVWKMAICSFSLCSIN